MPAYRELPSTLLNALTLLGFVDATADKSVVLARMVVNVILLVIFFI